MPLEPIPKEQMPCLHPEHNPPAYIYIPYGHQFRHICPACGYEVVLHSSVVYMGGNDGT